MSHQVFMHLHMHNEPCIRSSVVQHFKCGKMIESTMVVKGERRHRSSQEGSQLSNWNVRIALPTAVGHICTTALQIEEFRFTLHKEAFWGCTCRPTITVRIRFLKWLQDLKRKMERCFNGVIPRVVLGENASNYATK